MVTTFEGLRGPIHLFRHQPINGRLKASLISFLTLFLVTSYAKLPQPRFGIFMPKLDVYTLTSDVTDRVNSYLYRSKPSEIPLAEYPIISEDDLLSYDWNTHTLLLRHSIWYKLREPAVHGAPFVVVADGVPLYVGAFWTSISSFATPVPVIMWDQKRESTHLTIQRGYPSPEVAGEVADPRANDQLRKVLEELGKLKREPIPGKETFDADDNIATKRLDGGQKLVRIGIQVLFKADPAGLVEDIDKHGAGVEIDPAVELTLFGRISSSRPSCLESDNCHP